MQRGPLHKTRFALCSVPPSHFVRPAPRVWTTRPPRGDFYAARIHVWVRFFAAQDEPRHEREPWKPRKRLITDPLRGLRREPRGSGRTK